MEPVYDAHNLEEILAAEKAVMVYFSNDRCQVCKILRPKLKELINQQFGAIRMLYVDTEKSPLIAGQNRVFTHPTILVYFEGSEFRRFSRNINLHEFTQTLERPYRLLFSGD